MVLIYFESTYYFAETESVRCKLIVLKCRKASIRLPWTANRGKRMLAPSTLKYY